MISRSIKKITALILALLTVFSAFSVTVTAVDEFETQISAFPESYKPYLRQLHQKYPNWTFQAVNTGIDWKTAVESENVGDTSLITTAASDAFKSHESGDYNASADVYTQYDAGFVRANSLSVSYYMDPRNFLNESGIFQFEQLSFSDSITVSVVEQVLKGSFMSNKKITYYDTNGKQHTLNVKYSQAIYNAGKKHNVNPCYLASKIINEVGKNGSGSTSGKRSGYEGYYNFYNIGATSSSNPIVNGLIYAKGGSDGKATSYSRPWTDPEKAIMGGAEFIANGYISKGQDTGYFQRFNVSPDAVSQKYLHQYMTDISGAYYQSNTTYTTYNSLSMLGIKRVFKIPVYKNMTAESVQADTFALNDSKNQNGYVNVATLNVRSQPNTNSAIITTVPNRTAVKISETVLNSSSQANFIYYPYWYHVTFTYDNASYTGYVYSDSITLTSGKSVVTGSTFSLPYTSSPVEKPSYISDDSSVVKVNTDGTLTAVKVGSTLVRAYTSKGLYDTLLISVADGLKKVDGLYVSDKTASSVTVSWNAVTLASKYEVYTVANTGEEVLKATVTDTSYTFSNLKAGDAFYCKVRAVGEVNAQTKYGVMSSALSCSAYYKNITNLKQGKTDSSSVTLSWNKVSNASEYNVYSYNIATGKYVKLAETKSNQYKVTGLSAAQIYKYKVIARANVNGTKLDYAGATISVRTATKAPTKPKASDTGSDFVTLKWNAVAGATKYAVYKLGSNGKYTKIATVKSNSYTDSGLTPNTAVKYKVKAALKSNSTTYYSAYSPVLSASTGPAKVKNLKVSNITETSAKLTWSNVSSADGYYIYKYNSSTGKYTYVGKSKKAYYTLKNLSSGSSDKYAVRAYRNYNSVKYKGTRSSNLTVKTVPSKVTNVKFTQPTRNTYILSWSKVTGATGYEIYKKQSDGSYKKLATVSETSYKVGSQKSATSAKYKIRAYTKNGKSTLYGKYSNKLKATTIPKNVSSLRTAKKGKSYTLSWSKVSGAHGYSIYEYNPTTKKYEFVATTGSTSFVVTPKTTTTYKVVSYVKCNSKKYKASGKTISVKI